MKHKKQISDKKKFGLAAIACAMIGLIAATMAYFSSSHSFTNKFSAAKYSVETYDLFDTEKALDMWPGQTIDASVKVKNTGDVPILVRIKYVIKQLLGKLPDPFTAEEVEKTAGTNLKGYCFMYGNFNSNKFLFNGDGSDAKFYYQGVITKDDGEIEHLKNFRLGYSYDVSTSYLQSSDTSEPWKDGKWKGDRSNDKNLGEFRNLGCYPRNFYRIAVYIETIQATDENGNLLNANEVAKLDAAGLKELWTNLGK